MTGGYTPSPTARAHLNQLAQKIRNAMAAQGIETHYALAARLEITPGNVNNWLRAKNGPNAEAQLKLINLLGLVREDFIYLRKPETAKPSKPKPKPEAKGPAQTAVALLNAQTHTNGHDRLVPSPPAVSDVMVFRARSDGTVQVKLDAVLSFQRGAALMNYLLQFGLVVGNDEPGAPPVAAEP